MENWNSITDKLIHRNVNIIGLSINPLAQTIILLKRYKLNFPVFIVEDEKFIEDYKAGKTPQTILISEKNKIVRTWVGFLSIYDIINLIEKI